MDTSTWRETQEEALKNIRGVLAVMLEAFLESGKDMAAQGTAPYTHRDDTFAMKTLRSILE